MPARGRVNERKESIKHRRGGVHDGGEEGWTVAKGAYAMAGKRHRDATATVGKDGGTQSRMRYRREEVDR